MPDYIYLLENRLSPAQQAALRAIRDAARDESMTVFLTGGAVRDLTSGSPVRDLDVSVQGNALDLKKKLKEAGAAVWGEHAHSRTLFFGFPGSVRLELSSTRREEFPKPGKPVYEWATIHEDLRRRDFTVNAMAVSLNDGSYGLLMDPTNGVADIEARCLRLVSNYGFLEDPIRLLRATRLSARLGWQMDERTQQRFENARQEGVTSAIPAWQKGYELEEIGHEEAPLEMLKAMEAAGWMKELWPSWTSAQADVQGLEQMHEVMTRLQMQGIHPDGSAAAMELLTAKMPPKDLEALKKAFVRPGFVHEWNGLDAAADDFARHLTGKGANTPSATWKLFMTGNAEAILWLGLTGKGAAVQNKYKNLFNVWPAAKQKVPTALMLEMRITPDLERYPELLEELFYQTIDNKLETEEQMRAFLEPYSPPAPPPPVTVRRARAPKKSAEKKQTAAQRAAREEAPEGESVAEMAPVADQQAEAAEVAKRDIPAVTLPKAEAAGKGKAPVKVAEKAVPAKKAIPEHKAPAKDVPSPVQAATRLAGAKVTSAAAPAPKAGKPAAKAAAPPAKAAAKKAPVKSAAKANAKGHGAKAAPAKHGAKAASKRVPAKASHPAKGAPAKVKASSAKAKPAKSVAGKGAKPQAKVSSKATAKSAKKSAPAKKKR